MDKIKEPAMMLSLLDAVAIVGIIVYSYKQFEAIQLGMDSTNLTLKNLSKRVMEEKSDKQERLNYLTDLVGRFDDMEKFVEENFNNIELDLVEIVDSLAENNIEIDRPSQSKGRRSGDRIHNEKSHHDRNIKIKSKPQRTPGRDIRSRPDNENRSKPDSFRDPPREGRRRGGAGTGTTGGEGSPSYEERQELINSVRTNV